MSGAEGDDATDRFARALGRATIDAWAELPQAVQETLFERAVVAEHETLGAENLREGLARFLHDHHTRTRGVKKSGRPT